MDIADLLPKAADLQKAKVEGFVHSTLARLAKDLGAPADILRQIRSNGERYDVFMFQADFPSFPWALAVDRVESYNVQDLFTTPTKSPVFKKFVEYYPDWPTADQKSLMFFKAQGFTTLVIGTVLKMKEASVVLKGTIRGAEFYITTYAEFVDVVRDLGVLET
jgi:hypothetical protein